MGVPDFTILEALYSGRLVMPDVTVCPCVVISRRGRGVMGESGRPGAVPVRVRQWVRLRIAASGGVARSAALDNVAVNTPDGDGYLPACRRTQEFARSRFTWPEQFSCFRPATSRGAGIRAQSVRPLIQDYIIRAERHQPSDAAIIPIPDHELGQ